MFKNELNRLSQTLFVLFTLIAVVLLQGCFHSNSSTPSYSISGTVSGLIGTVVLQNNGGSDLTITSNGEFSFGSGLVSGASYSVAVSAHPTDLICRVTSGSGTVASANVTNISVICGVDATGYYTGDVFSDIKTLTDAQVLINDTRLMIISDADAVLYDGYMTITGSKYTVTLTIYKNGVKVGITDASGIIDKGEKITATMSTGSGYGLGSYLAMYHLTYNDMPASLGIIGEKRWNVTFNEDSGNYFFDIDTEGSLSHYNNYTNSMFETCKMNGTILPIGTSHLYEVNVTLSSCLTDDVNGDFTGLATTKQNTNPDDRLVFTISDGVYSTGDDVVRQ